MASKILLVDDDQTFLEFLGEYLGQQDYTTLTASSGAEALRAVYRERPDLVVLDVMMPGKVDGWDLCARLRQVADFPIILFGAACSEADRLRGFHLGADDFITKPFGFAELAARIQRLLARRQANPVADGVIYVSGNLVVDLDKHRVRRGQNVIPLTPTEFRLLVCLVQKHGEPISEDALAEEVWGPYRQADTTAVRRYIWLLRQKLEDDPDHPTRILNLRGLGYRLNTAPLRRPDGYD